MKSTIKARKYGEQNIEDQSIRPPRVCSWDWARGRIKSRRRRRRRRRQDVAVGLRLDLILTRTSLDEPPASSNNEHNYVNASPLLPPRFFYSPIFLHQLIFLLQLISLDLVAYPTDRFYQTSNYSNIFRRCSYFFLLHLAFLELITVKIVFIW